MRYVVVQLGARMHYAVPRILEQIGGLDCLVTDLCAAKGWPRVLRHVPKNCLFGGLRRLRDRLPQGIPASRIRCFETIGLKHAFDRLMARDRGAALKADLRAGSELAANAGNYDFRRATGVYAFNTAALEVFEIAGAKGLRCVLEQTIAPMKVERRLLAGEAARFPDWEPLGMSGSEGLVIDREEREWRCADLIVCGSDFVKQGLVESGVEGSRCVVVPYGVEGRRETRGHLRPRSPRLRVLFAGTVCLRKGVPYLIEAAQNCHGLIELRIAGQLKVTPQIARRISQYAQVLGPVPRSEMSDQYNWADVFVLPSICEGSATVCYEALAAGLPVITTHNAGSVIRDGHDGFVVPVRDSAAIEARLRQLASSPGLLEAMSEAAIETARRNNLGEYGERLTNALLVG